MSERHLKLVDNLVRAQNAIDRRHPQIARPRWYKIVTIEPPELVLASPSGVDGDMVDIRVVDYRFECRLNVLDDELPVQMLCPQSFEIGRLIRQVIHSLIAHRHVLLPRGFDLAASIARL
jgi:hypothetical protein